MINHKCDGNDVQQYLYKNFGTRKPQSANQCIFEFWKPFVKKGFGS